MKKIVSLLLVLSILVSLVPMTYAEDVYFPQYKGSSKSLVDAMKSLGIESSFSFREKVYIANFGDITPYVGSAEQNTAIYSLLCKGQLKKPLDDSALSEKPVPESSIGVSSDSNISQESGGIKLYSYFPACEQNEISIVDALKHIGFSHFSSFDTRATLAVLNGVVGDEREYQGSQQQNALLISYLKQGILKYRTEEQKVAAKLSNAIIMETIDSTPLRNAPKKAGKKVVDLPEGCLVYVTGQTTNDANNLWYEVSYFGFTVYAYSEHLRPHQHVFDIHSLDGKSTSCRCGEVEKEVAPAFFLVDDIVYAGPLFLLTSVAVLELCDAARPAVSSLYSDVASSISHIQNTIKGAKPKDQISIYQDSTGYYAFIVNLAGVAIAIDSADFRYRLGNNGSNGDPAYYKTIVIKNAAGKKDSLQIIDLSCKMDIKAACSHIDIMSGLKGFTGKLFDFEKADCNIYTYAKRDAERLCKEVIGCAMNSIAGYGSSNSLTIKNCDMHTETNKIDVFGTYEHYHLFTYKNGSIAKCVSHIFFGDMLTIGA